MPDTPLNLDQKLEALKFISQTQRALHEQRQKHELRAFFTTATLFVLLGAARYTGKAVLPSPLPTRIAVPIIIAILLVAGVSHLYLNGIHGANIVNKKFAQEAEDRIREILDQNGVRVPAPVDADRHHLFTRLWQPVVIWILAVVAAVLVTLP